MRPAFCLLLLLLLALPLAAQTPIQERPHLTVRGQAQVEVPADRATISFSVKGVGASLEAAVAAAEAKIRAIVTPLQALGLTENDIATSHFQSDENEGDKAFFSSRRDYRAVMYVEVTVDELDRLTETVGIISEGDIETLSDLNFSLRDPLAHQKHVRLQAVADARQQAEEIAKVLGVQLGSVLLVGDVQVLEDRSDRDHLYIRGGRSQEVSYYVDGRAYEEATLFGQRFRLNASATITFGLSN